MNKELILGAHISIEGGFDKAVDKTLEINANCAQIFTKSNRSWFAKNIDSQDAENFKNKLKKSGIKLFVAHASYLINLASKNPETVLKSCKALEAELDRCQTLGIKYLVLHPGSHLGAGEEEGIKKIISGINQVLEKSETQTEILLENMAGQGTSIGHELEQLKKIYQGIKNKSRVGFCLDTCHLFSAGYDFSTPEKLETLIAKIDSTLDLKKVKVIHLNDSKKEFESKVDRHENIGKGKIGTQALKNFTSHSAFVDAAKILETPTDETGHLIYKKEITIFVGKC